MSTTITYSVTVNRPLTGDMILTNTVVADELSGGNCVETAPSGDACSTTTPIRSFRVRKTSDPTAGTAVSVGQVVTYTVTITNDGTADLNPASITDDLSGVLDDATLEGAPSATAGAVQISGSELNGPATSPSMPPSH